MATRKFKKDALKNSPGRPNLRDVEAADEFYHVSRCCVNQNRRWRFVYVRNFTRGFRGRLFSIGGIGGM